MNIKNSEIDTNTATAPTQFTLCLLICFAVAIFLLSGSLSAEEIYNPFEDSPQQNLDSGIGNVEVYDPKATKTISGLTKQLLDDGVLYGDPSTSQFIRMDPNHRGGSTRGIQNAYENRGLTAPLDLDPKVKAIAESFQSAAEEIYKSFFPAGTFDNLGIDLSEIVKVPSVTIARHAPIPQSEIGQRGWHIDEGKGIALVHVVNDINEVNLATEYPVSVSEVEGTYVRYDAKYTARSATVKNTISGHLRSAVLGGRATPHRVPVAPPGYVPENGRYVLISFSKINTSHPDYPKHLMARMGRFMLDSDRAAQFAREVLEYEALIDEDQLEELIDEFMPELKEGYRDLDPDQQKQIGQRFYDPDLARDFPELDLELREIIGFGGDC